MGPEEGVAGVTEQGSQGGGLPGGGQEGHSLEALQGAGIIC